MVGSGEVAAVGGLHGGDHAQLGEAPDDLVGDGLDVFDPVSDGGGLLPNGAGPLPDGAGPLPKRCGPLVRRLLDRVERVPDGGVADRVGGGRHPGPVQLLDDVGVVRRIGPEGVGGLAVAVRPLQPGGAVVDRAVHEQLDAVHPPEPTAQALLLDQRAQPVRVHAGLAPGGDPQAQRQLTGLVQLGVEVEAVAVGVHRVATGETGGGHGAQRGGEAFAALGAGGLRGGALDQLAGGVLQQESGGVAVRVADHLGGLVEGARAVHAGQFQGARARQHRVGVEELEQCRDAVQDGAERGGLHRAVAEDVRVQAPGVQPGAGSESADLDGEGGPDGVQVGAAGEVEAVGEFGAADRVQVAVHQAGGDHGALEVDHRGRGVGEFADRAVVAERGDPAVHDREGGLRQEAAGGGVEQAGGEEDGGGTQFGSSAGAGWGSWGVWGIGGSRASRARRACRGIRWGQDCSGAGAGAGAVSGSSAGLNVPSDRPSSRSAVAAANRVTEDGWLRSLVLAWPARPSITTRIRTTVSTGSSVRNSPCSTPEAMTPLSRPRQPFSCSSTRSRRTGR